MPIARHKAAPEQIETLKNPHYSQADQSDTDSGFQN
jgi:hypothetical protein